MRGDNLELELGKMMWGPLLAVRAPHKGRDFFSPSNGKRTVGFRGDAKASGSDFQEQTQFQISWVLVRATCVQVGFLPQKSI